MVSFGTTEILKKPNHRQAGRFTELKLEAGELQKPIAVFVT
jgi:hypothetical protein